MGKQKGTKGSANKSKKDKPVALTSIKKTKTKAVASNLKKLNLQTKAKTEKADETFKTVREAVMSSGKPTKPMQTKPKSKQPASTPKSTVDMEATMEDFAKL